MIRPGDPERWANELHQALRPEEQEIMRLAKRQSDGFDASGLVAAGYTKSHRSAQLWINRLEMRGLLERYTAAHRLLWSVTEYGRWMTRNDKE